MLGKKLTLAAAGNNQQAGAGATDADFASTTLLLQGDTSNTSVNYNAFGDTSGNNVDLAPTGFTKGSSFTPYGTSWSNDFDGSGSYLNVSHSSSFTLDGSFTIEMWVNFSSQSQGYWDSILSIGKDATSSASGNGLTIYHMDSGSGGTDGGIAFQVGGTGNRVKSGSIRGTGWRHVAATRDGSNVCRLFIDGVGVGTSIVVSTSINSTEFGARIGLGDAGSSNYYDGYISNLRIVKGSALYTSNFTPSTTPLTAVSGTSLLTCNSNRFIDTSSNAHTITINGTPKVKGFAPFAETNTTDGGMFNNGDQNSFAKVTGDSAVALGSGDYCVEMWLYDNNPSKYTCPVDTRPGNPSGLGISIFLDTGNELEFFSGSSVQTGYTFPSYEWAHLAIVRQSGTVKLYVNGVQKGSVSETSNHSNDDLYIGNWFDYTAADYSFDGHIADFRITKGSPVYTTTFTPPTTPLTSVSGTSLLTLQERGSVRNTKAFNDSAAPSREITVDGNVNQGSFSPFSAEEGKWCNSFHDDGYIALPGDASFGYGTGDFTLELWVYLNKHKDYHEIWDQRTATQSAVSGIPIIYSDASGTLYYFNDGNRITGSFNANEWTHIAVSRSGTSTKMFINGVQAGSTYSDPTNYVAPASSWSLGGSLEQNNYFMDGYISNARVVKGTAVYTSNFTPPTSPLTAISGTSLLTCQSKRFVDNSSNDFTVSTSGTPKIVPFSPFAPSAAYSPATKGGSAYFDGSGDRIYYADDNSTKFGDGDYTVEAWVYPFGSGLGSAPVLNQSTGGAASDSSFFLSLQTDGIGHYVSDGTSWDYNANNSNLSLARQWNHAAWVRTGDYIYSYVNGERVGATLLPSGFTLGDSGRVVELGAQNNSNFFQGYISDLHVLQGEAKYTGSTYSVPTAPLTKTNSTSVLLNFTDAGIFDGAGKQNLETIGDVYVVNDVKKYGTGAIYFGGSDDFLKIPYSDFFVIGSGDYTVETWIYQQTAGEIVGAFNINSPYDGFLFSTNFSGTAGALAYFGSDGTNSETKTSTNIISNNTWTHIAMSKQGTTLRFFINGTLDSTHTLSFSPVGSQQQIHIGADSNSLTSPSREFRGYLDDLRITKGVARYTSSFTPPSAKLPNL